MRSLDTNPFVGLRPFESDESLLFFGRREQTLDVLQRLHKYHFVAVVGSSGSGKSSLIRAGLIPALKAGYLVNDRDQWIISVMKPGESPLCNLAKAILDHLTFENNVLTITSLEERIKEEGVEALLKILKPVFRENKNLFLLVDQFEELFRFALNQNNAEKRNEAIDFVNVLLELSAQKDLPIYIVITMRSDFIGDCSQFYDLPEALNQSQYLVPKLNRVQLKSTIEGPVKLSGAKINPALTARFLNDAETINDELPLLQHALMRVWESDENVDKDGELDLDDYENVGGIERALSNHADEALQGMTEQEVRLAKKIFQALTSIDENERKIRRPARLSELAAITGADNEMLIRIIDRFIEGNKSFLMCSKIEGKNDQLVDISHESLIRRWSVLNQWVAEEGESAKTLWRLDETAELYEKKETDLLTGNQLHQMVQWYNSAHPSSQWARRYTSNFERCINYLKESENEQKRQRRKRFVRRMIFSIGAIIIFIGVTVIAIILRQANIEKKKELALTYWKSARHAKEENGQLDAYHYIAEATSLAEDPQLTRTLLIDAEAYLPETYLENVVAYDDIINTVVFSPEDKYILIGGNNGIAKLLNRETGEMTPDIIQHNAPINSAEFSKDGKWVITASNDKTACLWSLHPFVKIKTFQHRAAVTSAVFSSDSKLLLTAGADSFAHVWDVQTGQQINSLHAPSAIVAALFSPDNKTIVTRGDNNQAQIWNRAIAKLLTSFEQQGKITALAIAPDGKQIVTADADSLRFWDLQTGMQLSAQHQNYTCTDITYSPNGSWILTASKDKTAQILNAQTGKQVGLAMKHEGAVYTVAFSNDGNTLATAGFDKTVRVWKFAPVTAKYPVLRLEHPNIVKCAVFSPDGKSILSADGATAQIWDVSSSRRIGQQMKHSLDVTTAVYNTSGSRILTTALDSTTRIWNIGGGLAASIKHRAAVLKAEFNPEGNRIITSTGDQYARIWDISKLPEATAIDSFKFNSNVYSAVFSPNGEKILVATSDSLVHVIRLASRKELAVLKHNDVRSAVFKPDGKRILTAGYDMNVRLWDAENSRQIGPAMKHANSVNTAVFSKDGQLIITAGFDTSPHLWSEITLQEVGIPKVHPQVVNSAVFSNDAQSILTSCRDKSVQLWQLEGDLDLAPSLVLLQARVITGVEFNFVTSETQCIPLEKWIDLKREYESQAKDHFSKCKYPKYNLWKRFQN